MAAGPGAAQFAASSRGTNFVALHKLDFQLQNSSILQRRSGKSLENSRVKRLGNDAKC
jgi:hypothetical protein